MIAAVELYRNPTIALVYDTARICTVCSGSYWLDEDGKPAQCVPCRMLAAGADRFVCGRWIVKSYGDHITAIPFQ